VKAGDLVIDGHDTRFVKPLIFSASSHFKPSQWFLSRACRIFLNIKFPETNSLVYKFEKTTKISKTKFVAKPPL